MSDFEDFYQTRYQEHNTKKVLRDVWNSAIESNRSKINKLIEKLGNQRILISEYKKEKINIEADNTDLTYELIIDSMKEHIEKLEKEIYELKMGKENEETN